MSVARLALPLLLAPALVVAATLAAPAQAMVVFRAPGSSHLVTFDGLTDSAGAAIAGTDPLDARVALRLTATDGFTWRFSYGVENQAGRAFDKARITGFGFDVGGSTFRSVTATGEFDRVRSGLVGGAFDTDYCFMAAGNGCDTNSNAGIRPGDGEDGTIRITFAARQDMVALSNLYVRWQGAQVDRVLPPRTDMPAVSVQWVGGDPAPEPAVWGLMILGFGLVGTAARRRRPANRTLA
jgi:hypothetical protein